jgi:pectate lyase
VEASGPRIVVFRVSGTVDLKSTLGIYNPYITIAGQTEPDDGIAIKRYL